MRGDFDGPLILLYKWDGQNNKEFGQWCDEQEFWNAPGTPFYTVTVRGLEILESIDHQPKANAIGFV